MPLLLHHGRNVAESQRQYSGELFASLIVVLPTKRRIRHLSREVITRTGAVPALPFHTLESLARSVYGAMEDPSQIVTGPIGTLLFSSAIRKSAEHLRYFKLRGKEKLPFRGTFERIIDVITSLKESGISPVVLREEAETGPPEERAKLQDMAAVYESYEEQLSLLHADDVAGVYRFLAARCTQQQFETAFRSLFPSVTTVSLAGFDEFTQPEIGFINRICSIPELSVSLLFDFLQGNRGLFGHLEENYTMFRRLGFSEVRTLPEREDVTFGLPAITHAPQVRDAAQHLARTLFNPEFNGPRRDLSRHITILRAKDRVHEIELICKLIKRLLIENPGRDPGSICVAMIHPQYYTDIVREVFPRYGIPANITDRYSLSRSPLVSALIALLQIPLNGYRRDDLLRALHTPYASVSTSSGTIDLSNLENVSRVLRIDRGYRTWLNRIASRRVRILEERSATANQNVAGDLDREERRLARAEDDVRAVELLMREVSGDHSPRGFRDRLFRLMDRLGVPERLLDGAVVGEGDLMEKDVRAFAKLREVLDEMVALLEFQEGASSSHPARFYVEQLKIAISNERYNILERFGQGVLVTSIEETRGLPVDVMIVAGMVDGEFPSVYQAEVFFSSHRQQLREQRHVWQNRYLFYQAVTNWSSHLFLTYPQRDDRIELVRSSFIDALLKVVRLEEYPDAGAVPWAADISSAGELLECYGPLDSSAAPKSFIPSGLHEALREVRATIAVERARLGNHSLPHYEGVILEALDPQRRKDLAGLRERVYSASQLESYGRCPYRFFAERILRLSPARPFEEDLTPLERGSILHEALFEFFMGRRETGKPPLAGCTDSDFEQAVGELSAIMSRKLDGVEIADAFWLVEQELILGRPGTGEGLVREFLLSERHRPPELNPSFFEASFGSQGRRAEKSDPLLSMDEPLKVGNVLLAGKVDRIDLGKNYFIVVDYKTGSTVPSFADLRDGLSLQLPLYLVTVEQLLRLADNRIMSPAGGFYYRIWKKVALTLGLGNEEFDAVASGPTGRSGQLFHSTAEFAGELGEAVKRVNQYLDGIAEGRYPLTTPDRIDKVCRTCEFKSMCRIQSYRHVQQEAPEES